MAVENHYRVIDGNQIIYRVTDNKYIRVTDAVELPEEPEDKLFIYFNNRLKDTSELTADNVANLYSVYDLYNDYFNKGVLFNVATAVVTAKWNNEINLEHIIVADTNADLIQVEAYLAGQKIIERVVENNNLINIIKLSEMHKCNQIVLTLIGQNNIYCGKVWYGAAMELPRFLIEPDYNFGLTSKSARSSGGQATGVQQPNLSKFDVAFERISNIDRAKMELYINTVQYTEPHFIEPYFMPEFPPMYATLVSAGKFSKRDEAGFWWDTGLSWQQAR
jgi:hypothetical protein